MSKFTNKFYELSIEPNGKFVNWVMKGFWKDMSVVPDFNKDWDTILSEVKAPFVILADLTYMKVFVPEVQKANDLKQQDIMKAGCVKTACLMANAESVTRVTLQKAVKDSGMDKVVQYFFVDGTDDQALAEGRSAQLIKAKAWLKN